MLLEKVAAWLEGLQAQMDGVPDMATWAAPQAVGGRLQIGCAAGGPPVRLPGGVRIPCLARLTWRDLLRARGAGVTEVVLVWQAEACGQCPGGLTTLPGYGVPVTVVPNWQPVPAAPATVDADHRQLLLAFLRRPPERVDDPLTKGVRALPPDYPLPLLQRGAQPGCTFCGACANVCKAYAMTPGQVTWRPDLCQECGRCVALCPAKVLGSVGPVRAGDWGDALAVAKAAERTCACGRAFYNSDPSAHCLRCDLLGQRSDVNANPTRYF